MLWVGVKRGAEEITSLHRRFDGRFLELGFGPEERPFRPHLTLGRFKSGKGAVGMTTIVKSHARTFCGEKTATGIILFRSELTPSGARYTPLFEAPLEGDPIPDAPAPEGTEDEDS